MALAPQTHNLVKAARQLYQEMSADAVLLLTETDMDWEAVRTLLPDGKLLIESVEGGVRVWDVATGKLVDPKTSNLQPTTAEKLHAVLKVPVPINFKNANMTLRVPTGKHQAVGMRRLADEL